MKPQQSGLITAAVDAHARFRESLFRLCATPWAGVIAACLYVLSSSSVCAATWPERYAEQHTDRLADPLGGWHVLSDYYQASTPVNNVMDALSIEWDYYSIHDIQGNFTGIVGYLISDPQGKLAGGDSAFLGLHLMPSGANLAFNGEFGDGFRNANFVNFGLDAYEASKHERSWYAADTEGSWGRQTPVRVNGDGVPEMHLEGATADFAWDLRVTQAWPERNSLPSREKTWVIGNDVNPLRLSLEHWTINIIWPTTYVRGTVTNRITGITYPIDGYGYRENAFGRWAFSFGGWDFYFMSDMQQEIQICFQSYHFNTRDLDFMEVDFIDPDTGDAVGMRIQGKNGELGWEHTRWAWNEQARQFVPQNARIIGSKDGYVIDVTAHVNGHNYPMLSSLTPLTNMFVINCLYPRYSGSIARTSGEVLYTFTDIQGGGEFGIMRSILGTQAAELLAAPLSRLYRAVFSSSFPVPEH